MGRAVQASGPASGRNDKRSKKILQVRTKRKKRKRDLEELHRNVLEAKRAARGGEVQHRTKLKTNFAKVLSNFADKRRDNEEGNEVKDGTSRKKKSKKICNRLLPEPMLGMYENGAKGREICRGAGRLDEINDARLRGNVLKLLKGDETSPESLWKKEGTEKKVGSNFDRPSDDSNQSDCETVKCCRVKDPPVLDNTKGIKRRNDERMRTTKVLGEAKIREKDQPSELPRQRDEDKCRRRLFEPDDEDEFTKNSSQIIDRPMITDHEIRFSPNTVKNVVDTKERNILNDDQENGTILRHVRSQKYNAKSRTHKSINKTLLDDHFWGWSPATCYERLCARISIDNFENKPYHRHRDPVSKIQKIITETFLQNARHWQRNSTDISKESRESGITAGAKNSIITSNDEEVIYQACTQDSDMEECSSSNSSKTMIGSWHPQNNQEDKSVYEKNNVPKRLKNSRQCQRMEEDSSANDKNGTNDLSSSDVVQKTINSVSAFLKQFNSHNNSRRKERNMFAMEIDESKRASKNREELNVCSDNSHRDVQLADTLKHIPRRNTMKHVPTILRRSNEHCGPVELMDEEENPCEFFRQKSAGRILEEQIFNEKNSIFSCQNPFSPMERESRTSGHMTISPCATSLLRDPNYYHYRTPARERSKELMEHRQLDRTNGHKSKLNFMRAKYNSNPRLSWSEEPEVKLSQENGYVEGLSDRKIEGTSRDFMEVVTVRSNTCRKRTECQNPQGVMDFRRNLEHQSKADIGEEIAGKRVAFLQHSDRFFNANHLDSVERFEASFEERKKHQNPEIKAHKTLPKFLRSAHHDNPRECMRFASCEFSSSEIERASYRLSEPKDITDKKLFLRQLGEPEHPVFHDRNSVESSMAIENENLANPPLVSSSFMPEDRPSRSWRHADIESWISQQQVQGQTGLQKLGNSQRNYQDPGPSEKSIDGLLDAEHRGILRKPVVLFRPIDEVRQRSTLQMPNVNSCHHDIPDSNVMRETVKNLRDIAFEEKTEKRPARGLENLSRERTRRRLSPSPCDQRFTVDPSNQLIFQSLHSCSQPVKFLAYEATDGENPRRIPVFGKSDNLDIDAGHHDKRRAPELNIIDGTLKNPTAGYRRFVQIVQTAGEQKNNNSQQFQCPPERIILTAGQNYFATTNNNNNYSTFVPRSANELGGIERQRSRRIAVMVPVPTSHEQHTSKMRSATLSAATGIDQNLISISAAQASATNVRPRLCRPAQFRLDQGSSVPLPVNANGDQEQSRYEMNVDFVDEPEAVDLPERIQLPDGRIGILLAQNCNRSSQLLDVDHPRTANPPCRIDGPKSHSENRAVYEFDENHENIYSQPIFQWNAGYGANEAYRRLTRANGAPDTFTGI